MHRPVDDAEYHRQVLSDARSPAALQLLGYASAAQCAASMSRLVPHALLRLLQPEDRLALGEGAPHSLPDRVRFVAHERENVAQEGFDALGPSGFTAAACLVWRTTQFLRWRGVRSLYGGGRSSASALQRVAVRRVVPPLAKPATKMPAEYLPPFGGN